MTQALDRRTLLASLAALAVLPLPAWSLPSAPALLLAQEAPDGVDPTGYLVSEKLDGVRAWWDGRRLWFRSGLPIAAPDWFLQSLPTTPLDGELWLGRGRFDAVAAAVRRQGPVDAEWRSIRYLAFELPGAPGSFAQRVAMLQAVVQRQATAHFGVVEQFELPGRQALQHRLDEVVRGGGEGLMLHRADAPYVTGRSPWLLKLKPWQDAEAVVIGHVGGRGRHAGRLGALRSAARTAASSSSARVCPTSSARTRRQPGPS
jgi:DNA ligase-1